MTLKARIILHLIATNFFGGPEKQIVAHLKHLNQNRYAGHLASYLEYGGSNELLAKAADEGIRTHGIPMHGPLDFQAQFKLNNLIARQKVDLLCVHGYKACVMGWWAGRIYKIPVIAFSRGYTSENKKIAFYNWLERQALRRVDGVIAVSEGQKKRLDSLGIRSPNTWVVRNAISVNPLKQNAAPEKRRQVYRELNIPESPKLVVAAGRLSPEKGHRFLVEAIARMDHQTRQACFVFCGDGMCQKELQDLAADLGVTRYCRFVGFRKDIADIFEVMDLMVLPSLTEGLPNVVLEAFASAKPVVASNVGGVPEVVEDGKNGILVPPQRPDLLADAIAKCLADRRFMKEMGKSGYHKVKSEFSVESQTAKLESIYCKILASQ